jgi:hypothetical protein
VLSGAVRGTEREADARVGVQPPQPILLPGCQRIGADGLDVDERQQAEHLQQLLAADQSGEPRDHVRVPGVAPEGDARHLPVMAYEKPQGLG